MYLLQKCKMKIWTFGFYQIEGLNRWDRFWTAKKGFEAADLEFVV